MDPLRKLSGLVGTAQSCLASQDNIIMSLRNKCMDLYQQGSLAQASADEWRERHTLDTSRMQQAVELCMQQQQPDSDLQRRLHVLQDEATSAFERVRQRTAQAQQMCDQLNEVIRGTNTAIDHPESNLHAGVSC